jgi:predicted transcriptional regulator
METIYKKLIGRSFPDFLKDRITIFYISSMRIQIHLNNEGRKTARAKTIAKISRVIVRGGSSGVTQSELERKLSISRSYCSELVKSLEAQGNLMRVANANTWRIYDRKFYPGPVSGLVRVGFLRSSEYVPILSHIIRAARAMGSEIMPIEYDSAIRALEDLSHGTLELSLVPTLPSLDFSLMNRNTLILMGVSSGGSGIITSDHNCKDCILTSESSTMISLVMEFMKDYPQTQVFLDPRSGIENFVNGKCCSIAIWEPFLSELISDGKYKLTRTYHEVLGGFPCCALSSNIEFTEREVAMVHLILRGYMSDPLALRNTDDWLRSVGYIARATRCSRELIEKSLASYNFKDTTIDHDEVRRLGIRMSSSQSDKIFYKFSGYSGTTQ